MPTPTAPRIRSQAVWDRARDAYLAGQTAAVVCARFDLGMSAFRARARRCGWRRADHLDPFVDDPDEQLCYLPLDDEGDAPHPLQAGVRYNGASDLKISAWRRARRAIDAGDVLEARRWLRLMNELGGLAYIENLDVDGLLKDQPPEAPVADVHSVDSVHPNFQVQCTECTESTSPEASGPRARRLAPPDPWA